MLLKQKNPSFPRNVALKTFGELLILFSTMVNLLHLLYLKDQRCCLLHLLKQNYSAKNVSKNSHLDDSGIFLPAFSYRTNLKLHNISITRKIVKDIIAKLDSSVVSGLDCIPVVILENCEPGISYIAAEVINMCLRESCFSDSWKVPSVVPVLKNVGERSTANNYRPVSLLSVVTKVFEKYVNNGIVDPLEKCGFFLVPSIALDLLDQMQIF